MADTSDIESKPTGLKIKIFSGKESEWSEWKAKFQAVLRSKKLLKHLSSEMPDEGLGDDSELFVSAGETALDKWMDNDQALYYELIIHTTGTACKLVQQFEERTQGQKAWEVLKEKYEGAGTFETMELIEELVSFKIADPSKDPDLSFIKVERLQRRLRDRGEEYTDNMLRDLVLFKLPRDKYQGLLSTIGGPEGKRPTYEVTKERIRSHWRTFIREDRSPVDDDEEDGSDKALMSKAAGEGDKQKIKCFKCKKPGHKSFECPQQQRNNQGGGGGRGNRGGGRGHHGARGRGGPRGARGFGAGRHNNNYQRNDWKSPQGDGSGLKCFGCNGFGHKIHECPTNKKKHEGHQQRDGEDPKANTALQEDEEIALIAKNVDPKTEAVGTVHKETWIVDSGATAHMVSSKEGLSDIVWGKGRVIVAGGKVLESVGTGTVKAMVKAKDGRIVPVAFKDALIVPELRRNLLSVKRIVASGGKVLFRPFDAVIVTPKGIELALKQVGNLYELEYGGRRYYPSSGGETGVAAKKQEQAFSVSDEERLWHMRLGHRNMRDVKQLAGMEVGIPASFKGNKEGRSCDICEVGKHTHASFPAKGKDGKLASEPMELVHVDVFGPIDTPSVSGSMYAILFTDDYSKWRSIYFMKSKAQSLEKLKLYLDDVAGLLHGRKVQRLHSDNGGEFISRAFRKYCKRSGILHTYTGPRAPQQNGVAERSNRTVVEMARCLRLESGLDKELWAETCKTSVYVLNRVPSAVLDGQTPYYKLFGKQARLDHLKVFGCRAYAQIYANERTKMDPKAWRGIMIGYDEHNNRCYRIYDPIRKVIRRTVHVTFDESVFPAKEKKNSLDGEVTTPVAEARRNAEVRDQGFVELEYPGVEQTPMGNKDGNQRRVRFNLLPAKSNLMPRRDAVVEEEKRAEVDEQDINSDAGTNGSDGDAEESSAPPPEIRTSTNENPYAREYNVNTRGEGARDWRCQEEDCDIRGVHRAHLGVHQAYQSAEEILGDPTSHKEAMQSKNSEKWKQAEDEEYQAHLDNGTWELVERPEGVNVVGSRWVFKTKLDENGKIVKFKARGVAQGYSQMEGIDFGKVFAPTARQTTIRTLLSVTAWKDWELENMDVNVAFLNAEVEEEIYMRQLEGYEVYGPNGEELVCKLKKSIYGLKQASRNWNQTIDKWMKDYGFKASEADPCLYVKREKQEMIVVIIWVDDLIIAGSCKQIIQAFKAAISRRFSMKDLGALKWILGVEIKRDRSRRRIEMTQTAYINQMLERFGMAECKPVGAPAEGVLCRITAENGGRPDKLYMSIVGSLLYASMITRPDITYAVQALGRHMQSSGNEHMIAAKRVLRYLQGTKDLGLIYEAGETGSGNGIGGQLCVVGFSDADWGGDLDTRRSTTGYLFMIEETGGVVSWGSKLQPTVALSSAEAEYMAACAAVQEAVHLRLLMSDLGFEQREPTVIYEDNQGCIALSDNPVHHRRTKHIDIRYHFIRERVTSKEIELKYVPTEHQLADLLTKGLAKPRVVALRNSILGYD